MSFIFISGGGGTVSTEFAVGTGSGVVYARAIRRCPSNSRCPEGGLDAISGSSWENVGHGARAFLLTTLTDLQEIYCVAKG